MTVKRIACLGDSNTYGFDPLGKPEKRYPPDSRWPEILAEKTGWTVFNLGGNGWEIPIPAAKKSGALTIKHAVTLIEETMPIDLLVIMLGSNDILDSTNWVCFRDALSVNDAITGAASRIYKNMSRFLDELETVFPGLPILLVSPPKLFMLAYHLDVVFRLRNLFERLGEKHGLYFAPACDWAIPLCPDPDNVHFTAEGHTLFAAKLQEIIEKIECNNSEDEHHET